MANNITRETIEHIKSSEGLVLTAYPDPGSKDGNPWTIGYGTTRINGKAVPKGLKITKEQAEQYLINDLKDFAKKIDNVIDVPLNDNQYGALLSFSYNVGFHAFTGSTLLRNLNKKDYNSVPAQMMRWNKNDGKVMTGLTNRRKAEVALWLKK